MKLILQQMKPHVSETTMWEVTGITPTSNAVIIHGTELVAPGIPTPRQHELVLGADVLDALRARKEEFHNRMKASVKQILTGTMDAVQMEQYANGLRRRGLLDLVKVLNGQLHQVRDAVENQK